MHKEKPIKTSSVKIKKVRIEKFRRFQRGLEIEIGPQITLIVGENGTSKSTLLGMLCQPFYFDSKKKKSLYTENYNEMNLGAFRRIDGKHFKSEYSDVFRMSKAFDKIGEHEYTMFLDGDCIFNEIKTDGLPVKSKTRKGILRFVVGKTHEKGEGNFPHPVIYIGLNRLSPLALSKDVVLESDHKLSSEEKKWFNTKHREILLILKEDDNLDYMKTGQASKGDHLIRTESDYDGESCSAGQDNIGKLLTAILSFKRLKAELGDKYQGGVLLVDELDASLHYSAQEKLMACLIDAVMEINLQVVATTHSLYMIKKACHSYMRSHVNVLYLHLEDNVVKLKPSLEYGDMMDLLTARSSERDLNNAATKTTVLLEDPIATAFFSHIIGKFLKQHITIHGAKESNSRTSLPNGTLAKLALQSIPEFKKMIFIVDGDSKKLLSPKAPSLLALPGDTYPEKLLYGFLRSLNDADYFWATAKRNNYTNKECFKNHWTIPESADDEKKFLKDWYKSQNSTNFRPWGIQAKLGFERWIKNYPNECKMFCETFMDILEKVSKQKMPASLREKILKQFV